jgi:hypothetical protein
MKVSELQGAMLDYWVARAEGKMTPSIRCGNPYYSVPGGQHYYSPSTDWSQGGPLVEREKITLEPNPYGLEQWAACHGPHDKEPIWIWINGATPLIAAMRCLVASKFGEEVPDEETKE